MHICNPSTHEKARDSGIQGHLPLCSVFRVILSYIETLSQTHTCIRMHTCTYACTHACTHAHTHVHMHRHKLKRQNIRIFEKMFLKISYGIFWTYFCPENLFLNLEKCLQGLGLLCLKARWVFSLWGVHFIHFTEVAFMKIIMTLLPRAHAYFSCH